MSLVNGVAQVALTVTDLARAGAFYADALGLKPLFAVPGISFLDAGGVRVMLSAHGKPSGDRGTLVYFKVDDLDDAHRTLLARGVHFEQAPHPVGRTPTSEVLLAFCNDPDGNMIGLMGERPIAS